MAKHTFKILLCSHRKIFKVRSPFLNILHERVKPSPDLKWRLEPFYNKIERCLFFLECTLIALALSSSVLSKWFPTGRFKMLTTHMKKIVLSITN